ALLLERGINVNLPPSASHTSALQAALFSLQTQVFDTLLDAGADVNAHDPRFGTALIPAANYGNGMYLTKLLERGANPHLVGGKYGLVGNFFRSFSRVSETEL